MYAWAHKNREDNVRAGVLVSGVDANEERKKGHRTVGRCLYDALSRVEYNPRLPTISRFPVYDSPYRRGCIGGGPNIRPDQGMIGQKLILV